MKYSLFEIMIMHTEAKHKRLEILKYIYERLKMKNSIQDAYNHDCEYGIWNMEHVMYIKNH